MNDPGKRKKLSGNWFLSVAINEGFVRADDEPMTDLNSLNGDEYGRQFLHTHAQFITDYLFSKCREYDL